MIQAVLADDEVLARQKLRQLLRSDSELTIVGECSTAGETIEVVRATKPDLLFLDIQMPGMDGFDIISAISSDEGLPTPCVIFTTAFDQYALKAFDIHAVDYLLKPFTGERLASSVDRARKQILLNRQPIKNDAVGATKNPYVNRLVFKSRGRIIFLPVSDIRHISAEENYVRICAQSETHLLRETMAHLEERLDPEIFLRVHRSSIVNLQHVKEVRTEPDGEYAVVLVNGEKLTMSRSYRSRINGWITHS